MLIIALCALVIGPTHSVEDFRLSPSFKVDGQLVLDPRRSFGQGGRSWLILVTGRKRHTIKNLGQLSGHVKISSPEQALNFARLRGSPVLMHALSDYGIECEAVDRKSVGSSYVFGATDVLARLKGSPNGFYGYGDAKLLGKSGVKPATCVVHGGKFVVVRTLVTFEGFGHTYLVTVREKVGRDGSYEARSIKTVPTKGIWSFAFGK